MNPSTNSPTQSEGVPLPAPLPIRVRPVAGESVEHYIRRLARANHLRPSLLLVYVRNPAVPNGAIRPDRLAAASGTPLAALSRTLTGLPKPRPDRDRQKPKPPTHDSQATRKAELFQGIRYDASRGFSIRKIAERRHTHRRMIRQALASPDLPPPPRKRINRAAPITDPIRDAIDALLDQDLNLSNWQIWTIIFDQHDSDASYATVCAYIHSRAIRQTRENDTQAVQDEHPTLASQIR